MVPTSASCSSRRSRSPAAMVHLSGPCCHLPAGYDGARNRDSRREMAVDGDPRAATYRGSVSEAAPATEPDTGRWIALAVCATALFMTLLDVSVTNVALLSIGQATGAGPATLQWIVSGYTLAFGLVPVLGGRLGDDHGRRRMFIIGVA